MRRLLLALACCAAPPAQVFIVDSANGPGANFTSIAGAIAGVPDGAILQVRAGTYSEFVVTDKSLTILGEPGVVVHSLGMPPVTIENLAADKAVTLRGVTWTTALGQPTTLCRNCIGTVLIEECNVDFATTPRGGHIDVQMCERVFVRHSRIETGGPTQSCVTSWLSSVVLERCWLRAASRAVEIIDGRVHLADCHLESTGNSFWGSTLVVMNQGHLVVNADTTFVGSPATPTPAAGGSGQVIYDPSTVFQAITVPAFSGGASAAARSVPRVYASTEPLGGTATAQFDLPLWSAGLLAAGFPESPLTVPWADRPLWIGGDAVVRAAGSVSPLRHTYRVPNAPSILGTQIAWQGAALGFGNVTLSNPSVYAHF